VSAAPRPLLVFLHGVGSSGADLAPLAESWRSALPTAAFATPDAPTPFDRGGAGRQWFSIAGVTEADRAERIAAARAGFDRTVAAAVAAQGLEGRLDRVALIGFSQGAIMALDALAGGRWPVGAIVAFAGRLAAAPAGAATATPALLVHGAADPVIPAAETLLAAEALRAAGVAAQSLVLPGVGHMIAPAGAAAALRFLEAQGFGG
jgi:phospholipase/carboxylesterase